MRNIRPLMRNYKCLCATMEGSLVEKRKATMTKCDVPGCAIELEPRWTVKLYAEDGDLVRTIPFIPESDARFRVDHWEGV